MIVLVPMAGGDEAFKERGYPYAKPLIEIHGKPLVEHAWSCLRPLQPEKFVFVGRPFNYAASVAGEDGVRKAIGLLREEVSRNMAMLGVNGLSELDASYLLPAHPVS